MKHLDENGYDHLIRVQHCAVCHKPIYQYLSNEILAPHKACQWQHYVVVSHAALKSKGLEAREVLTHIPRHVNLSFCNDCLPIWSPVDKNCGYCGQLVDKTQDHSTCETFDRIPGEGFRSPKQYVFHAGCLPPLFSKIHEKRTH